MPSWSRETKRPGSKKSSASNAPSDYYLSRPIDITVLPRRLTFDYLPEEPEESEDPEAAKKPEDKGRYLEVPIEIKHSPTKMSFGPLTDVDGYKGPHKLTRSNAIRRVNSEQTLARSNSGLREAPLQRSNTVLQPRELSRELPREQRQKRYKQLEHLKKT